MTRPASFLAASLLALGGISSTASAQGFGYNAGSAGGAAAALGFTASPPITWNRSLPATTSAPAVEPATTGSVARRDRTWIRLRLR